MMYQYISELSDKDKEKTVYILCLRECDMLELRQAMEDLYDKGVRNFFLDEITEVTDFQKYGNTFSDYLQQKELKSLSLERTSLELCLRPIVYLYDRIQ
mgnify:CR=1 FL=1